MGDAEAAAGAAIFECLSGETLCIPKPFQDAVPSSSRSKVSAAPATTTSPRSTGRRTRSMGYLPPHPGRYSEQLHHWLSRWAVTPSAADLVSSTAQMPDPSDFRFRPERMLRPSSRRSSLFTRLQRPFIGPDQFAAMDRAACGRLPGKSLFGAAHGRKPKLRRVMRRRTGQPFPRDSAGEVRRVFIPFGVPQAHSDSQGNCASSRVMASAVVCPGTRRTGMAGGGGIRARRAR